MTVLELSRWQFGITTVYHFIFVPLTIGLSLVDEIVVLEHGRVAERGTHAKLIQASGTYQRLWGALPGPSPTTNRATTPPIRSTGPSWRPGRPSSRTMG